MKKFLIVFFVVFAANLGCKKLDEGDRLCGCSPVVEPPITLVIKGTNGIDMLNPATNGYFAVNNIKMYYQSGGTEKQVSFGLSQPFSYGAGSTLKFEYYQLLSTELLTLASSTNPPNLYLKLGNGEPLQLKVTMASGQKYKVEKLLVNNVEAAAAESPLKDMRPNIFYINL